jgi:L-seryl-tRNA(Ser) seleniumtransferase
LARAFRALPVPVVGRVHDGVFYLDLRCLDDEKLFLNQLERLQLDADRLPEEKTLESTGEN